MTKKAKNPATVYAAEGRVKEVYGYDGRAYTRGDRIELHPGTDLWMQGARYGTVTGIIDTLEDQVRVKLDKLPEQRFSGPAERFKVVG